MWLINTSTVRPREFTSSTPPYVIFSHTTATTEASFEELEQTRSDSCKEKFNIIERACDLARAAGIEWLWNHSACVDERSSAALSEAINSLAQVHRNCEYIIIYLEDLDWEPGGEDLTSERLATCRWIRNIWAIPEIIFPREASFYSSEWKQIGTKKSLLLHLSSIIGIDRAVLEDSDCLEDYSIARRMSWASEMSVSRIEDSAYALLGLFDISMPIVYGEGRKAFLKLQEEIMRDTDDLSLLAWDDLDDQEYNGLFAQSSACFRRFRNGPTTSLFVKGEVQIHCAGITMQTSFWKTGNGLFLPLEGQDGSTCCIPLSQWNDCFVRKGSQAEWNLSAPMTPENRRVCVKRHVSAHVSRKISAYKQSVRPDSPRSHGPPDETGTTKESVYSIMDYNFNDAMHSIEVPVEDCDMTPQYASSVSVSDVSSQEDRIAWSAHARGSVKGSLDALDSGVRPSWVHKATSESDCGSEDCPPADIDETGFRTPRNDSKYQKEIHGSQDSVQFNEPQSTETQVLDVAQLTEELADIAAEKFFAGFPRQSAKRSLAPWQSQNRKRPKLMESSEDLEGVETYDSEDGETVVVKKARFFACPFYVRDKKLANCVTRNHLHSIDDVKDHVCGEHRQPMFCPVCKEEFPSGRTRDTHIRLRNCDPNNSITVDGITDDQEERLNRESNSHLPEEQRWFQIWDMIFPQNDRPRSAFYTNEREINVCAFQQFWMLSGKQTVAKFLKKKDSRSYSIRNEERKLKAIYDLVMENVVDRIFVDLATLREQFELT